MTDTPSLEDLLAEEKAIALGGFDYADAWTLGSHIQAAAAERGLAIGIEVVHGNTQVFLALMPGSTPDNLDWLRRKRSTALRFHHSSLYVRLLSESRGVNFHTRYRLPDADYAASGGSVPVFIRDVGVVGAVTVSGLPDVEDHRLVIAALRSLV